MMNKKKLNKPFIRISVNRIISVTRFTNLIFLKIPDTKKSKGRGITYAQWVMKKRGSGRKKISHGYFRSLLFKVGFAEDLRWQNYGGGVKAFGSLSEFVSAHWTSRLGLFTAENFEIPGTIFHEDQVRPKCRILRIKQYFFYLQGKDATKNKFLFAFKLIVW